MTSGGVTTNDVLNRSQQSRIIDITPNLVNGAGDEASKAFNRELEELISRENLIAARQQLETWQGSKRVRKHPDYFLRMTSLLKVYSGLGEFAKAATVLQQMQDYASSKTDTDSYQLTLLNAEANLLMSQDSLKQASKLFHQVVSITKAADSTSIQYLAALNNLAACQMRVPDFDLARKNLHLARTKWVKHLGSNQHIYYAIMSQNLGEAYLKSVGESAGFTEFFLKDALAIYEELLGTNHIKYVESLSQLSSYYAKRAKFRKTYQYELSALKILSRLIKQNFDYLSEKEKQAYYAFFQEKYESFYTLATNYEKEIPASLEDAYNLLLEMKGLLFSEELSLRAAIANSQDPQVQKTFAQWKAQRKKLVAIYQLSEEELTRKNVSIQAEENKPTVVTQH